MPSKWPRRKPVHAMLSGPASFALSLILGALQRYPMRLLRAVTRRPLSCAQGPTAQRGARKHEQVVHNRRVGRSSSWEITS